MRTAILKHLWWAVFLTSAILLIAHSLKLATLTVDTTSIFLIVLMLISPFASSIRKLKFGDFEAEIDPKEVERVKEAAELGLAQTPATPEATPEIRRTASAILDLGKSDEVLALAKLRIELEKILRRLERAISPPENKRPISLVAIVRRLASLEVIPFEIAAPLQEVIAICNRAIHGEALSAGSASSIIEVGTELLQALYWQSSELLSGRVIDERRIENTEMERLSNARYRLTTVIPLVKEPKLVVRDVSQEQLDQYLEGYAEFAEFIVRVEEVTS